MVIALPSNQFVVASPTIDHIVTAHAPQYVVAGLSINEVVAGRTREDVVTRSKLVGEVRLNGSRIPDEAAIEDDPLHAASAKVITDSHAVRPIPKTDA
ncbi:hypothetical protein D3C87_951560 [compost metagenome]